eukprot:5628875-Amphidinium_carterae.2
MKTSIAQSRMKLRFDAAALFKTQFPKIWLREGRTQEMEKALKRAQAVVSILQKNTIAVPNGSKYELTVRTCDASVLAVEVSSKERQSFVAFFK